MYKKAFIAVFTAFAVLSLAVVPVFAQLTDNFAPVTATGWAFVRTCHGCVSGCATMWLFLTSGAPVDPPNADYIKLSVCGQCFWWTVNSVKFCNNFMTVCASPTCPGSAPCCITVIVQEKSPYCVSAFGSCVSFIGRGIIVDG